MHADVHPRNILIDSAGRVKVIDYGLSRALEDAGEDLYASENGGHPWTRRVFPIQLAGNGSIYAGIISFAASPDARTVLVGYRSPNSDERLFRSTDGGRS